MFYLVLFNGRIGLKRANSPLLSGKYTFRQVMCLYLYKSIADRLLGSVARLRMSDSEVSEAGGIA